MEVAFGGAGTQRLRRSTRPGFSHGEEVNEVLGYRPTTLSGVWNTELRPYGVS